MLEREREREREGEGERERESETETEKEREGSTMYVILYSYEFHGLSRMTCYYAIIKHHNWYVPRSILSTQVQPISTIILSQLPSFPDQKYIVLFRSQTIPQHCIDVSVSDGVYGDDDLWSTRGYIV